MAKGKEKMNKKGKEKEEKELNRRGKSKEKAEKVKGRWRNERRDETIEMKKEIYWKAKRKYNFNKEMIKKKHFY